MFEPCKARHVGSEPMQVRSAANDIGARIGCTSGYETEYRELLKSLRNETLCNRLLCPAMYSWTASSRVSGDASAPRMLNARSARQFEHSGSALNVVCP